MLCGCGVVWFLKVVGLLVVTKLNNSFLMDCVSNVFVSVNSFSMACVNC